MSKRLFLYIPALLVLIFAAMLGLGIYQAKKTDGEAFVGKPIPEFYLKDLARPEQERTLADLPKEPFVLNIWASWCTYCRQEFPLLSQISQQGIKVVGINYADQTQAALNTLETLGNPFLFNIQDSQDKLVSQLGGKQAPQTYLVDKNGVIQAAHLGLLRESDWQQYFAPVLQQLKAH